MIVLSFYFINYYNVHFFGFWISRLRWFQFVQKMNFRNLIPFHLRNARYLRFLFLFHISYELLLLYKNKHIGWSMLSGYITFCKVAERDFLQIWQMVEAKIGHLNREKNRSLTTKIILSWICIGIIINWLTCQ